MRTLRLAATAALVSLALSGCVPDLNLPSNPRPTSTPDPTPVATELRPYYTQQLNWESCGRDYQCTSAFAPLDWENPGGERIELSLIRYTALNHDPLGSLLVNPGGPGGSGVDFIRDSIDYAVGAPLRQAYDIVGFDPRGVNHSTPVTCYTDPADTDQFLFGLSEFDEFSPEWYAEAEEVAQDFADACYRNTGELLGHVDTYSAARDLDLLRAVLGDAKLNYLGYSYGTRLGAVYAELFPENVGHLVLDGAVDPTVDAFELSLTQAVGFESAMRAYLAYCLGQGGCAFSGTVASAMREIRHILDELDENPLRNSDGRMLGSDAMFTAIIVPLYSRDNWPYLGYLFTAVAKGDPSTAFFLNDVYYSRDERGGYSDNSTEAFLAINCLDLPATSDRAELLRQREELIAAAPVFGPQMAGAIDLCAFWPFPWTGRSGAVHAVGAAPIVVIGTTNDPATPFRWSEALADQLESGVLLTYEGEGHTAYTSGSSCIDRAVERFFLEDVVPAEGTVC